MHVIGEKYQIPFLGVVTFFFLIFRILAIWEIDFRDFGHLGNRIRDISFGIFTLEILGFGILTFVILEIGISTFRILVFGILTFEILVFRILAFGGWNLEF